MPLNLTDRIKAINRSNNFSGAPQEKAPVIEPIPEPAIEEAEPSFDLEAEIKELKETLEECKGEIRKINKHLNTIKKTLKNA